VAWKRDGNRILVEAAVPPGTTAVVSLPDGSDDFEVGSGGHRWDIPAAPAAGVRPVASLDSPLAEIIDDPDAYAAVWQAIGAQDSGGAAAFRKDTVWYRQTSLDQSLIFTQPAVKREIAAALDALNERRAAAPSRTHENPRN
jgi:alpha-L-rhamnosidase